MSLDFESAAEVLHQVWEKHMPEIIEQYDSPSEILKRMSEQEPER